jgi:CheY-like chemotaxis protein
MSHILIVDDDANVRELLRRFLEPAGHEVLEAENAETDVHSVGSSPPAVARCDVHIPMFQSMRNSSIINP